MSDSELVIVPKRRWSVWLWLTLIVAIIGGTSMAVNGMQQATVRQCLSTLAVQTKSPTPEQINACQATKTVKEDVQ